MPPHCDTMDGPVVRVAKKALKDKDVKVVLPWIPKNGEAEVKKAFQKTLRVRGESQEAKELADYWFYETCVRIHRMGEGASYTGIKPADQEVNPAIEVADKCLEDGSIQKVVDLLKSLVKEGVREKYEQVTGKKLKAEESVDAGREWVHAYVDFIHFVKGIYDATQGLAPQRKHE